MSFWAILYNLLIGPLELFFEILYSRANQLVHNPGLSIVFLSLAMNFLVLPLYKRADAMQEEERETDKRLSPTVKHIKKAFSGDERFMILQTFYRENNYKPTDALKGSVSLLLEIPFFMAAYNFLSGLPILRGASFGPITNLGVPDGMLVIGGVAINVLPILMTAINLVSSAIYTKGSSFKSKLQLDVMAGLFLVLLYNSPSGLVFYWTLNNLFSLFKNIFMRLKNPKKVFCKLSSYFGVAVLAFVIVAHPMPTAKSQILLCCMTLLLQLPLGVSYLGKHFHGEDSLILNKKDRATFWICGIFMTVLTGMFIPSGVIGASPEEFLSTFTHTSPLLYVLNSTLTAAGFFLVWFGIFYMLANDTGKKWMSCGMSALCAIAVVDFMFFGKDYGNMSANLVYDIYPAYTQKVVNLGIVVVVALAVWILWRKKQELIRFTALTAALAAVAMSGFHVMQIHGVTTEKTEQLEQIPEDLPVIPLSRNGKNVMILMMDRGISSYVPFIMEEKPEIREQFAGFTYYPNTVSFGGHTNFGAPALFGGYEYTPEELNRRDGESLQSKNDEALRVMPVSFLDQGYEVSVFDPPCAGYDWIPDLRIYDAYPEIHACNSMRTVHMENEEAEQAQRECAQWMRNFFCYSTMKIAPVCIQPHLYDNGRYNDLDTVRSQMMNGLYAAEGLKMHFRHAYQVLCNLEEMTQISDQEQNTFLMLTNDTTHEPTLLQEPDYVPAYQVDNHQVDGKYEKGFSLNGIHLQMDQELQVKHYHVNMAAFLKLGEWFDYLRAEGVYDNTRIILVSDHGFETHQRAEMMTSEGEDLMFYNPLLLVKDFDAEEFRTDMTFMTNADTPLLAMHGLWDQPVNPFTGKPIDNTRKLTGVQKICCSHEYDIGKNNGNTYLPGPWYSVHDNIFDLNNWKYLGVK